MRVAGFSFIKNAIKFDYPIVEAINSILPICDAFFIAVGASDDETLALIKAIDSDKIKIIETVWDDSLREGGKVLAVETDKAFKAIPDEYDWCFYIQGDEVIHQKYLANIKSGMEAHKDDNRVDGLLLKYLHFYGSYDYVGEHSQWYKNEVRVIKNNKNFYSYRDAQGFRKDNDQKLYVKRVDAYVYHYGWVKHPEAMQKKQESFQKLWHSDKWVDKHVPKTDTYDYLKNIDALKRFEGSHPEVMKERLVRKNWKFDYDVSFNRTGVKDRFKGFVWKTMGIDLNYKNYRLL